MKTTYTLNLSIYSTSGSGYSALGKIEIPANSEGIFSCSGTVPSTTTALWIGVEFKDNQNQGAYFYSDNWCLKTLN